MAQLKKISIVLKPKINSDFENVIPNLAAWLLKRKKEVYFLSSEKERLQKIFKNDIKNLNFVTESDLHTLTDLIITLGGDGTLIGVCRNIHKNSPAIFGVNMGHLGFITEFTRSEFFDQLEHTLKGNFKTTELPLFQVEVFSKKKLKATFKGYFLNDVVVNNNQISRMLTLSVESEGEHIYNLAGDGLIISSPVGSTAYSLAAGGPIIHPSVKAMTLTPICAHSLTHRPLVIPDHSNIVIKSAKTDVSIKLTLDGQQQVTIGPNDYIKVTKSKLKTKIVQLVKNPERTFYKTLKDKFTHGVREIK